MKIPLSIRRRCRTAMMAGAFNDPAAKAPRRARGTGAASLRKANARQARRGQRFGGDSVTITIPLRTMTEANTSGTHWGPKAGRAKLQRRRVAEYVRLVALPELPVVMTMTRLGRRRLDDDNLASSFKHVRDELADVYGVDDASDQIEWHVAQQVSGDYAVTITIEHKQGTP